MNNAKKLDATVKRTIKSLAEGIKEDVKRINWKVQNGKDIKKELGLITLKANKIMEDSDKLYDEKDSFFI